VVAAVALIPVAVTETAGALALLQESIPAMTSAWAVDAEKRLKASAAAVEEGTMGIVRDRERTSRAPNGCLEEASVVFMVFLLGFV
jgi:hypothetical protein